MGGGTGGWDGLRRLIDISNCLVEWSDVCNVRDGTSFFCSVDGRGCLRGCNGGCCFPQLILICFPKSSKFCMSSSARSASCGFEH